MKHLKLFEEIIHFEKDVKNLSGSQKDYLAQYKFYFGDYVRCTAILQKYGHTKSDKIFIIGSLDILSNWKIDGIYGIYEIGGVIGDNDYDDEFVQWVREDQLIKVEDYEVAAIKYNM